MINPNELRLGNLISVNGKICVVFALDQDGFVEGYEYGGDREDHEQFTNPDNTHPITLSPEILTDWCPFDKPYPGHEIYATSILDGHVFVAYQFGSPFPCSLIMSVPQEERDWTILIPREIKYLHEMQNVIHELTGLELEIKIPEKSLS